MKGWALMLLAAGCAEVEPLALVAVTFNAGTTEGLAHDAEPDDGYGSAEATLSDQHYGDGLAWRTVVEDTQRYFAQLQPDLVAFQEIFYSGECPNVPASARAGFVCESWQNGDPTVAQVILGMGYQVACHLEKPDKCIAVKSTLGRFEGCDDSLCLDGLEGMRIAGCGGGSRVGMGEIRLADETRLQVINVHGTSGLTNEDVDCRVQQFDYAFSLVSQRTILFGDLNTDPVRFAGGDDSADAFVSHARGSALAFVTDVGEDAEPTYGGIVNIDHVLSDTFEGECEAGSPSDVTYFDHRPIVCRMTESEER